jgi:hypothetical protein
MNEIDNFKAATRDKFAVAALQGLLANDACMREILERDDSPSSVANTVVARAYLYADECMQHTELKFE